MDWNNITRFNFTCAIPGGAWLEDVTGRRLWVSAGVIAERKGWEWYTRQVARQGMLTGCWVGVKD